MVGVLLLLLLLLLLPCCVVACCCVVVLLASACLCRCCARECGSERTVGGLWLLAVVRGDCDAVACRGCMCGRDVDGDEVNCWNKALCVCACVVPVRVCVVASGGQPQAGWWPDCCW